MWFVCWAPGSRSDASSMVRELRGPWPEPSAQGVAFVRNLSREVPRLQHDICGATLKPCWRALLESSSAGELQIPVDDAARPQVRPPRPCEVLAVRLMAAGTQGPKP